jgi:long-chain acyl-CoA synthetase
VKEHFICDLGIMHAGGVPSTIYKQLKSGQIEYISNLLEAKVAFVGDAELFEEVNKARENCPNMKYIILVIVGLMVGVLKTKKHIHIY